jgi:hypothetical protein
VKQTFPRAVPELAPCSALSPLARWHRGCRGRHSAPR